MFLGTGVGGVADGVPGPIQTRGLAVPDAQHTVVDGVREGVGQLAAPHRGSAQFLVEAGFVDDVVLVHQRLVGNDLPVESAQRGTLVSGDDRGGTQAGQLVRPHLVQRHPHQRLHASEEELALVLAVLGVEILWCRFGRGATHHFGHDDPPLVSVGSR